MLAIVWRWKDQGLAPETARKAKANREYSVEIRSLNMLYRSYGSESIDCVAHEGSGEGHLSEPLKKR